MKDKNIMLIKNQYSLWSKIKLYLGKNAFILTWDKKGNNIELKISYNNLAKFNSNCKKKRKIVN